MREKLYLDYNATTPCDAQVVDAMSGFLQKDFGNTSSIHHSFGWIANEALEKSTDQIASSLMIDPDHIVYTSGATEGINMVLNSFCKKYQLTGKHIVTCKTEHKAVLDTCAYIEKYEGVSVSYINVDESGIIDLNELRDSIRPETILVAIMYANNETGVIQPLQEISDIISSKDIYLFTDATQALGKIPLDNVFKYADFSCFSGHKIYGPKGVGMVYAKNKKAYLMLKSLIHGGGQQKKLRGGTMNTPGIVGFAKAVAISQDDLEKEYIRIKKLRDTLERELLQIELSYANGVLAYRLPNTCNISFAYVNGGNLLRALSKDMAISNGSACNAASENPSHVLTAMNIKADLASASLRISLGKHTSEEDINQAISIITDQVSTFREQNILWERRKPKRSQG